MSLPLLPGNNFDRKLGSEKFHKSHFFDICNEQQMMTGPHRPGIGGVAIPGQVIPPKHSSYPKGEGTNAPAWVAYDRQVLSFKAYYQEGVTERHDEQYRIRNCKLYFYLEDDSIQVVEPVVKNAGMPQGTIIRRHRIPKPAPLDDQYFTVEDFNIGKELILYGKKFKLCDADEFTKNFLYKLGVRVGDPAEIPANPYTKLREDQEKDMQPLRPYERLDGGRKWRDLDRQVLRFDAYWDDTESMFGDRRELTLHYYLADDTVEVLEKIPNNSGRHKFPTFLARARLPKNAPLPLLRPGEHTARTLLNVFGDGGIGSRYILDSLKTGAVYDDFYTDADMTIGSTINVYGRQIVLTNCDGFSRDYYKRTYGVEKFEPINYKAAPPRPMPRPIPPYSGFGGEEDTLSNCMSLIPKAAGRDFIKFMEKDRNGLDGHVLRFVAKIDNDSPIDTTRKIIISYYLSDDTISLYEPPIRNNGIIPGDFMERRRLKKLHDWDNMDGTADFYTARDLYVGARCVFNKWKFVIIDCDEYVLRYMENNSDEFPQANIAMIMNKVINAVKDQEKGIKEAFIGSDGQQNGLVPYSVFRAELQKLGVLTEHEIITVGRWYSAKVPNEVDMKTVIAIAQEKLKKGAFENFDLLLDACRTSDESDAKVLPRQEFRAIFLSFKGPVPQDVFSLLEQNFLVDGNIKYPELIAAINYRTNPVQMIQYQQATKVRCCSGERNVSGVTEVNYKALIDGLFPAGKKD